MKGSNSLAEDLMRRYSEELNESEIDLIQESFWTGLRSALYKKIIRCKDGWYQWAYITGKKNRYANGKRIILAPEILTILWGTVNYLQSVEGQEELMDIGITNDTPEHVDDLISLISEAKTDREIKADQFRLFLKHKHKIMRFLLR
jgi:hypothetical protein